MIWSKTRTLSLLMTATLFAVVLAAPGASADCVSTPKLPAPGLVPASFDRPLACAQASIGGEGPPRGTECVLERACYYTGGGPSVPGCPPGYSWQGTGVYVQDPITQQWVEVHDCLIDWTNPPI